MNEQTLRVLAGIGHMACPAMMVLLVLLVLAAVTDPRKRPHDAPGSPGERRRSHPLRRLLFVLMVPAAIPVLIFEFPCGKIVARRNTCLANTRALGYGLLMYAQDNDERFPPAGAWSEAVEIENSRTPWGAGPDVLDCPSASGPFDYALNGQMGAVRLNDVLMPADTALVFESDAPRRSFAGGPSDVAQDRHSGGSHICFTDGHAKWTNASRRAEAVWSPKQEHPRPEAAGR